MNREAFHQLLKRYAENTCSEKERRLIDQWYELLDDDARLTEDNAVSEEVEQRLWNNIRKRVQMGSALVVPVKASRFDWKMWAAAIVITAALVSSFYFYKSSREDMGLLNTPLKEGLLEKVNNGQSTQIFPLEDGSEVILDPGARLAYPLHFAGDKREVYLKGGAFFTISKNASRPFYVYNDRVVTQVLGTSFSIKTGNEQVEVAVRTGRVAVYENEAPAGGEVVLPKTNGVIITLNEKVTYYKEDRHFVTSLVDTPLTIAAATGKPREVKFDFEDAPLSEVLDSLGKAYNIQIIVENENLNHCPFTGDISNQSLYGKLELICESLQAT